MRETEIFENATLSVTTVMEIQIWKFKIERVTADELPLSCLAGTVLLGWRCLAWLAIVLTDIFRTCAWAVRNRVDDRTYSLTAPEACKHLAFGDWECVQS